MSASRQDASGFTNEQVLDLDALKQHHRFVALASENPEIKELETKEFEKFPQDDYLTFKLSPEGKSVAFYFARSKRAQPSNTRYRYNYQRYFIEQEVKIEGVSSPEGYSPYLSKTFLQALKEVDTNPLDLVRKYGTHIVAKYKLGPYMRLKLEAPSNKFSADELYTIAQASKGEITLSQEEARKLELYSESIDLHYTQGGTSYLVGRVVSDSKPLLHPYNTKNLFIDLVSWQEGIQKHSNTYLTTDLAEEGLIPITALLPDLSLKVKYATAIILEQKRLLGERLGLNFILSDPQTGAIIKYNGSELAVNFDYTEEGYHSLLRGVSSGNPFAESEIQQGANNEGEWIFRPQDNGLWLIEGIETKKYLCRDFQLRTTKEDTKGLRYWLLNPIVPSIDGNMSSLSNLLIQIAQ